MSVKDETSSRTLEPDEYVVNNEIQRRNGIDALELLQGSFGSEDTSDEQFLDVGCGPGDFTHDCLLPRCPPCRRIMAVDVSEDMVKYAREHFAHPKICYDVLDIASEDVSDFVERHGEFDRVYSFFCLHWMKDQATVLKNVARMIKPGGGCLLLFNASSPTMRFHKKMAAMDRWQKYREILEKPIPPSVDIADKEALISYVKGLLRTADLTPTRCEVLRMEHAFPSLENLIEEESPLLLKDVTDESTKWWAEKDAGDSPLDGQVFLVHAYKPRSPSVFTAIYDVVYNHPKKVRFPGVVRDHYFFSHGDHILEISVRHVPEMPAYSAWIMNAFDGSPDYGRHISAACFRNSETLIYKHSR